MGMTREDIELVIKIPEELYKATINGLNAEEIWDLRVAIKNGTPLPKGHGRLIDADDLFDNTCIDEIPTVIEADKAESEDKK